MTEPIDQDTKDLIKKEAQTAANFEYDLDYPDEIHYVKGYIRGATVWAEKLKQERSKVIDPILEILKCHIEWGHIDCRGNEFSDFDWDVLKKEIKSLALK